MIGAKLGAGREADVYAWGDDAVVKVYRPGFPGHHTEALVLASLSGLGIAPELVDTLTHDGRTGLVQQRLPGPDMLGVLQRQPWRLLHLARGLAEAHLAVHQVPAPKELPDLRQVVADRIGQADLPPRLREHALRVLDNLPDGDRLCHGDYHPGNVLVADRLGVIDWPNATRGAPPADHARTMLLLRHADPLPGTSAVSRALMATGRAALARAYARTYRAGYPMSSPQVDRWLVVQTAARLAEGIDGERPTLIRLLDRHRRRSAP